MRSFTRSTLRENAPVVLLLLISCLVTLLAFFAQQRMQREKIAANATADAKEFAGALQNGVNAYLHLTRDFGGFIAASNQVQLPHFDAYLKTVHAIEGHPGLSYLGFIPRVANPEKDRFETEVRRTDKRFAVRAAGADPAHVYPYLYAYPRDARSAALRGIDFSSIPERWAAMQKARDTGETIATARHEYAFGPRTAPIIAVFTPVYDLALPADTMEQRRAALRGFVFSIYHLRAMIEGLFGENFHAQFDLEIFDGTPSPANILYDGDGQPHALLKEREFDIHHREQVTIGGREWQMFLFPKQQYFARYESTLGLAILVTGLGSSAALAWALALWLRRNRIRLGGEKQTLRFDELFESHPSAVYLLDPQRRFVNANSRALIEFMFSKEELVGKSIEQMIVPEKQELARSRFADVLKGNSVTYDSAIFDGQGHRIELSVIMIPIKANDKVIHIVGIAENITAQRALAWQLKESKQMLQLVIDHIPQRVFWKNTQSEYLGCNVAFCRDAGLEEPEQIIGKSDFDLAWRANAALYRADDAATLSTGQAKVNYEEPQNRDDGTTSWLRTSKIPLSNIDGQTVALLGLYEDITSRKEMEGQLRAMAHYDGLTKLANRTFFYHHLEQAVARVKRRGGLLALMYFDIDHFKTVNDTHGHGVGDILLTAFAQRITVAVRDMDVVARLGGDEFALLLDDTPDRSAAESVADKLVKAMEPPFAVGERVLSVSTSIGVAFYMRGMNADNVIQRADGAMYKAKRGGGNRYEIDSEPV